MTGIIGFDELASAPVLAFDADVVIVGSGAAGATAARVLAEGGFDVLVLEAGPQITADDVRSDLYSVARRAWRQLGFQAAEGRSFTAILQGRCVGGSTAVNGAIIHRMPEKIFQIWRDQGHVGPGLSYARLERIWDQLDNELGVGPVPESMRGENNRLMARGCDALGITHNVIQRNVIDCQGAAHCLQGCPTSRRQSMDVAYIPRAISHGARVITHAEVERVQHSGGRAQGVQGRLFDPVAGRTGPTFTATARKAVLLAASAIQTPLILARSGVGRRSRLVGRRFQAHPGSAVLGIFDDPVRMWIGATQGHESTHYWDERMKFETLALPLELLAVRLPEYGPELVREVARCGHVAQWAVQVRAQSHGTISRRWDGTAKIRYSLAVEDVRTLKSGITRLCELMFAAGASEVLPGIHGIPQRIQTMDPLAQLDALPDDPRLFHTVATHLFGTATMGTDPRSSVVDSHCQCHELSGLYVVDSSCFPTNLGVNPQHAICAIAWHAAEQLLA